MMKTDTQLQRDILDELAWTPSISEAEIGVAVKAGVVTLTGTVGTWAQKHAAERVVERVAGVRGYADELQVKLTSLFKRSDTEIAHAAVNALHWNVEVPESVKVKVEDGWVTLEGRVEWQYQMRAAERTVRYLRGVRGVTNAIKVAPKPVSTFDVSHRIKDSLRRNAELDADRITVDARDGHVTLKGTVRSYAERRDAELAAWAAPGVMAVDDRITVAL